MGAGAEMDMEESEMRVKMLWTDKHREDPLWMGIIVVKKKILESVSKYCTEYDR